MNRLTAGLAMRSLDTLHFTTEGAARYGYAIGEFLTTITG
jgi:hypothetical protein